MCVGAACSELLFKNYTILLERDKCMCVQYFLVLPVFTLFKITDTEIYILSFLTRGVGSNSEVKPRKRGTF